MADLDYTAVVAAQREKTRQPITVDLGEHVISFSGHLPLDGLISGIIDGQSGDELQASMVMAFFRANCSDEDLRYLADSGLEQSDLGQLYMDVARVIAGRPTQASSNSSNGQPEIGDASNDITQTAPAGPSGDSAMQSTP